MGSIIGQRIDCNGVNGVGALRRRHIYTQQKLTQVATPTPPHPPIVFTAADQHSQFIRGEITTYLYLLDLHS